MEYSLHHRVKAVLAFQMVAISSDTTTQGIVIDTKGFESLEYIISSGTITDGTYDFLLLEDDDENFTTSTLVGTDEILGSIVGFVPADDFVVKRIGSIGKKRYQRLDIVSTGVSTGVDIMGATAVLSNAYFNPVV